MALSKEELLQMANLAKLALSEEEMQRFSGEMEEMFRFADAMQELPPQPGPAPQQAAGAGESLPAPSALRADVAQPSLSRDELLQNVPGTDRGYVVFRAGK